MASLYISEFGNGVSSIGTAGAQMMPQPALVDQVVASGAGSLQSGAFSAKTKAVLIAADVASCVAFGVNPVATTANFRIPANAPPIAFAVAPGHKVAVIAAT